MSRPSEDRPDPNPSPAWFDEAVALSSESWRVLSERVRRAPARIPALMTAHGEDWLRPFFVEE